MSRLVVAVMTVLISALVVPASALAHADAAQAQYRVAKEVTTRPTEQGSLPFTGHSLLLILLIGVVITAIGVALQMILRHKQQ